MLINTEELVQLVNIVPCLTDYKDVLQLEVNAGEVVFSNMDFSNGVKSRVLKKVSRLRVARLPPFLEDADVESQL